jgi:hypothetical protein
MRISKIAEWDHEQILPLASAGREAPRAERPVEKNTTNHI